MDITLSIPKEWEKEFTSDRFADCFSRVISDAYYNPCLAGRYELETLCMLRIALQDATIIKESDAT